MASAMSWTSAIFMQWTLSMGPLLLLVLVPLLLPLLLLLLHSMAIMAMRYMWSAMLSGPATLQRTQPVRFVSCMCMCQQSMCQFGQGTSGGRQAGTPLGQAIASLLIAQSFTLRFCSRVKKSMADLASGTEDMAAADGDCCCCC
jgi:hypothetical protein